MKIYTEQSLRNFEFWSGAKDRVKYLTWSELDTIESMFEELYPDGMSDTQINDTFWFDFEWICEMLGTTEDEVFERDVE